MSTMETRKRPSPRPTPAQIAARFARIRARWTERMHRLRAGMPPVGRSVRVNEVGVGATARRRLATIGYE